MVKQLKDYYRILEVAPFATRDEIKKSYRALAFKYHPDTNKSSYAETYFHEIQEAYEILYDDNRRRRYDEDRWLSGMSTRARDKQVVTPQWILKETQRLSRHMAVVDTYRMSHNTLHDYIFLLLSDSHMAILQQAGDEKINQEIVKELLSSTRGLKFIYMEPVANRLAQLAGSNSALIEMIYSSVRERKRSDSWEKYLPLVIALITLLLCAIMFVWGRR